MIRDTLLQMLAESFPGRAFHAGTPPGPIAVFPAAHPEVGEVIIWEDGPDLICDIGRITHGHFGVSDTEVTGGEREQRVVRSVIGFLRDLFANRVLMWTSAGGSGGWRVIGRELAASPISPGPDARCYLWTAPATLRP